MDESPGLLTVASEEASLVVATASAHASAPASRVACASKPASPGFAAESTCVAASPPVAASLAVEASGVAVVALSTGADESPPPSADAECSAPPSESEGKLLTHPVLTNIAVSETSHILFITSPCHENCSSVIMWHISVAAAMSISPLCHS
jgi:hypothetical protein